MSVEFDGDQHQRSILYAKLLQPSDTTPSLINWLTKTGIAKSPEGANRILVGVFIFSAVLTLYMLVKTFYNPVPPLSPHDKYLLEPASKYQLKR